MTAVCHPTDARQWAKAARGFHSIRSRPLTKTQQAKNGGCFCFIIDHPYKAISYFSSSLRITSCNARRPISCNTNGFEATAVSRERRLESLGAHRWLSYGKTSLGEPFQATAGKRCTQYDNESKYTLSVASSPPAQFDETTICDPSNLARDCAQQEQFHY
jgi:hypothetical protein